MRLSPKLRSGIVGVLRDAVPELRAVYLHGSRAGDARHATPASDYDLAFLTAHGDAPSPTLRYALLARLCELLGVDHVDLVDAGAAHDHTLLRSILDGDRLWVRHGDEGEVEAWEAKRLTMANDWWLGERELREGYVADLRKRYAS